MDSSYCLAQWTNCIVEWDKGNMKAGLSTKCRSGPISETCYWGLMARSQQQWVANIMIRRCLGDFVSKNELYPTSTSELSLISSQTSFTGKIHVIHNTNNQMLSNWHLFSMTPLYTIVLAKNYHVYADLLWSSCFYPNLATPQQPKPLHFRREIFSECSLSNSDPFL